MDLSDLTDEVYRETQLLETGRVIQSAIQHGVLFWGDPGLLKQALRILVDNGVKYTPEGGGVTIRLEAEREPGPPVGDRHRGGHRSGGAPPGL